MNTPTAEEGNSEYHEQITTAEEITKPAHLRTYVDDWMLFKTGDHRAATTLVNTLAVTCEALEDKGMKVSRDNGYACLQWHHQDT
eukprot:3718068-Heterocapsa_arctica.AAC.1